MTLPWIVTTSILTTIVVTTGQRLQYIPRRHHQPWYKQQLTQPCPEVPPNGCSICGEGKCVKDPLGILTFPGQPPVSCAVLEIAGLNGLLDPGQCQSLPDLVAEPCDCEGDDVVPTTPPDVAQPCPDVPPDGCSICGDGLCVTDPQGVIASPGQPPVSCAVLEVAGYGGLLDPGQCDALPEVVADACACDSQIPGPPTVPTTAAPSARPISVAPISDAPISDAPISDAPVSAAPSARPTVVCVDLM